MSLRSVWRKLRVVRFDEGLMGSGRAIDWVVPIDGRLD